MAAPAAVHRWCSRQHRGEARDFVWSGVQHSAETMPETAYETAYEMAYDMAYETANT